MSPGEPRAELSCDSCGEPRGPQRATCTPCRAFLLDARLGSHDWRRNAATRPGSRAGESLLDATKRERSELQG